MKITTILRAAIIAAAILVISGATTAKAEERPRLYVSVDCMKSTAADYSDTEVDMWLPIYQELVNQGHLNSWTLYWVRYGDRSRCDYYTVMTYLGQDQLNAHPVIKKVFQAVHQDTDFEAAMARTWSSRQHVATELWMLVDNTEIGEHSFAIVNRMYAEDPDAYERMETQDFKPGHQVLVDGGYRAGWGLYELLSPLGTTIPYNFSTVDFVDHLNPVPMAESMLTAHPDRDLEEMHDLLALRAHVSSETWALVATTNSPASQ